MKDYKFMKIKSVLVGSFFYFSPFYFIHSNLKAVGDAVKKVGNEDNFIQIQENNQMSLLEILEKMIVKSI